MDVLVLTVFVSLVLAVAGLLFLFRVVKEGDSEHGDRLALLPLDEDLPQTESDVEKETDHDA